MWSSENESCDNSEYDESSDEMMRFLDSYPIWTKKSACSDSRSMDSFTSDEEFRFRKLHQGPYRELANSYLIEIAEALQRDLDGTINFIAEDEFRSTDISIEVESVGQLSFPLTVDCITKLISISTKACFGKGEETILNEDVRDTHQIPGKNLKVTFNLNSLSELLDRVRNKMVFSKDCNLVVELHDMLIYSPGQFFEFHQDSEKATNMIGTLVIILASPHIGGNLVVKHGTKEHIFVSENLAAKNFKCVSFYADCMHKIEKVREGYRVALTYKLILQRKENVHSQPVNQCLKTALQNYFTNSENSPSQVITKLVFFLDHSYSKHSLRWHLLKGTDQMNADALLSAGKELDLKAYLVLVQIHQMWNNRDDYQRSEIVDVTLDDVEYTLSHWINEDNEVLPKGERTVSHSEVCWTKETSASFKPDSKNCDGFTGNEGLNLDYWYDRAAVVLLPSSSNVQKKFKDNPRKALEEMLTTKCSPGHEEEVKQTVKTVKKFLRHGLSDKTGFELLVKVALYLKDKDLSMSILSYLQWTILNCEIWEALAKLESQYGDDWCIEVLNEWKKEKVPPHFAYCGGKADGVLKKVNCFVDKYLTCGGSLKVAEVILTEQVRQISSNKEVSRKRETISVKLDELNRRMEIITEFFIACTSIGNSSLVKQIVGYISSVAPLYPETDLAEIYLKLKKDVPSNLAICEPLKVYLQKSIRAVIAFGMKAKTDWSIAEQLYCNCVICRRINTFLLSKTEMKKGWQMQKKEKDHVTYEFSWLPDLPVSITKLKHLILTKTNQLHKEAQKKFLALKQYLKILDS